MYKKWEESLSKVRLFQNISLDELNAILICLNPKIMNYKKNEYITIMGDKYEGIGIIVSGEVIVTKEKLNGDRVIMAKLSSGQIFGEMIAYSNQKKWPATVIALEDSTILFFPPEKIIGSCPKMCSGHKLLINNMLEIVTKKALHLNKKVEYLMIKSIRGKIAHYLYENYYRTGKTTFDIPLNRNEMAEFLNISRPSMSRELSKMKEEGIIDYYKSSFKLLDLETLKLYVE